MLMQIHCATHVVVASTERRGDRPSRNYDEWIKRYALCELTLISAVPQSVRDPFARMSQLSKRNVAM